jgi:hypothetical protein
MAARRADATRELSDPKTPFARVQRLLRKLPPEVPAEVGAEAALRLRDQHAWWGFARNVHALPARVIEVVLAQLATEERSRLALYFVAAMQGSTNLERDWARAVAGLLDLNTSYGWGSKQRRAKILGLARGPLLPAIQAAAGQGEGPLLDMLAVLVADGSEASVDALLPHFHAAASRKSELLDHLERLKTHAAKTAPMRAMFESVERLLGARNEASPALALARVVLGEDVETFSVHWSVSSVELNSSRGGVPEYQCHATLDSTSAVWFSVSVHHVPGALAEHRRTSFGSRGEHEVDELGLGRCTPEELPAWFARAAKTLGVRWVVSVWSSSLRGAKRTRAVEWLAGELPRGA